MPIEDLRDWIDRVDEMGELTRIEGANLRSDVGGLTDLYQWTMGNPALLFDRIESHPPGFRVLSNGLTSLRRVAMTVGMPEVETPAELVQALRAKVTSLEPVAAQLVDDGPILENHVTGGDIDLNAFPAPVWHPRDGGPYLGTGDIVITRDPDTGWVNAGTYRVQLHDAQTVGIYISTGKHGRLIRDKYWERGKGCPVAISIGHDPLLMIVGGLEVDYGTNELDIAGAIRGAAVPVIQAPYTGLPVPAKSEIVLEGEILPHETRPEGPFGEWAGYYATAQKPAPVVHVESVLHRNDPIVLGCLPGKPPNDNTYFRSPMRAALIWNELERAGIPGIAGVWSHEAGGGRLFNIVAIKQLYPGHSKQVGMATASCHAGAYANRFVVVVDDDIDPTDTDEVLWALCTRTNVTSDIDVMRRCWSTGLDPMAYEGSDGSGFFNDRLVIDACRPYDRLSSFPAVARLTADEAARTRERWPQLFERDGSVARGVRNARPNDPA